MTLPSRTVPTVRTVRDALSGLRGVVVAGLLLEAVFAVTLALGGHLNTAEAAFPTAVTPTHDLQLGLVASIAAVLISSSAFYAGAWVAVRRDSLDSRTIAVVVAFAVLFGCTLLAAPPVGSSDVYGYFFFGRTLSQHGANPLISAPSSWVATDPLFSYAPWPASPYPYGPLWALVSAAVSWLAGDNVALAVLGFKLLDLGCYGLLGMAIYGIRRAVGDTKPGVAILLFLWNPLILFELVVNAHNDGLTTLLAILAIWAGVKRRPDLGIPLLALASMVKITPVVLLPLLLLATCGSRRLERTGIGRTVVGLAVSILVACALYAPFWSGPDLLSGLAAQNTRIGVSIVAFLTYILSVYGISAGTELRMAAYLAFAGITLAIVYRHWRRRVDLWISSFDIVLALLLIATLWFQPWYLTLAIFLAIASGDRERIRFAVVFSISALSTYLFINPAVASYVAGNGERIQQAAILSFLLIACDYAVFIPPAVSVYISHRKGKA